MGINMNTSSKPRVARVVDVHIHGIQFQHYTVVLPLKLAKYHDGWHIKDSLDRTIVLNIRQEPFTNFQEAVQILSKICSIISVPLNRK